MAQTSWKTGGVAGVQPLKLLLCLDSLAAGGTEMNAVRTVERLGARGHDARLLVLRAEGPLLRRCQANDLRVLEFRVPPLRKGGSLVRAAAFVRLVRQLGVDVIHTQDRYTNAFLVPWARLAGVASVASRRWWNLQPSRGIAAGNRLAFHLAHRVVANSARVAELVARVDGLSAGKVAVVPNFLDEWAVAPAGASDRLEVRQRLGIPTEARVVGAVANLRPVKGHGVLLAAMAEVMSSRSDVWLALVGDGECRPALERQAAEAGIAGRVIFTGARTAPVNWHLAFNISVLSSLSEGFPNTVLEAMAAGNAVVATDVGGTADAVIHGESGYLVPPRATGPLAEAVGAVLDDASLAARMGAVGRERALAEFQAEAVIPRLEGVYCSALPGCQ
jgi:L-malate glycosyltransferase